MNNRRFYALVAAASAATFVSCTSTKSAYVATPPPAAPKTNTAASAPMAKSVVGPVTPTPQPAKPVQPMVKKPVLPVYASQATLRGRMRSIGSDTMDTVMLGWQGLFKKHHSSVRFMHQGKGSSTALPALIEGQADFGPMSRSMKESEVASFKAKFGYEPIQLRVAVDALAVYVHPDNPIASRGLDFQQLDAVFGSSLARGGAQQVSTWGQLGLTGDWASAPVRVYGRNKASGTYGFFQKAVLKKGDYKATNTELVGSAEVIRSVAADRFSIGYSGVGYKNQTVRTVRLSEGVGATKYPAEAQPTYSGQYPLARFLYLTVNLKPGQTASDLQREFLSFVYSAEGQRIVKENGFYPLSPSLCREELRKVGL